MFTHKCIAQISSSIILITLSKSQTHSNPSLLRLKWKKGGTLRLTDEFFLFVTFSEPYYICKRVLMYAWIKMRPDCKLIRALFNPQKLPHSSRCRSPNHRRARGDFLLLIHVDTLKIVEGKRLHYWTASLFLDFFLQRSLASRNGNKIGQLAWSEILVLPHQDIYDYPSVKTHFHL